MNFLAAVNWCIVAAALLGLGIKFIAPNRFFGVREAKTSTMLVLAALGCSAIGNLMGMHPPIAAYRGVFIVAEVACVALAFYYLRKERARARID